MRIDNSHDVISGADSDSRAIYIDRRIPQYSPHLRDKSGRPANLWKYLTIHETQEADAMARGMAYERAHQTIATPAERHAVEADGVDWQAYTREMDGYLSKIEREKVTKPPPADQHVAPHRALRRQGKR